MGWVYGIHSLNPAVLREISTLAPDLIGQRLRAAGLSRADVGGEEGDPVDPNTALTLLATTRQWELDKSLDDIEGLIDLVPDLAPVRALLKEMQDFKASGIAARFHPEEIGLMGIAMPATIAGALAAARPYGGAGGRKKFEATPISAMRRLLSAGLRKRLLTDDYVWDNWNRIVEAMEWADQRGEWLGLAMS
jgi:hypothetical protein